MSRHNFLSPLRFRIVESIPHSVIRNPLAALGFRITEWDNAPSRARSGSSANAETVGTQRGSWIESRMRVFISGRWRSPGRLAFWFHIASAERVRRTGVVGWVGEKLGWTTSIQSARGFCCASPFSQSNVSLCELTGHRPVGRESPDLDVRPLAALPQRTAVSSRPFDAPSCRRRCSEVRTPRRTTGGR